jgi:hypothetical protein
MSIDTNLNLLDRFNNINILIKELEDDSNNNLPKIITIGNLSEKFGYSQLEWSYILNEYVLQTKNVYEKLIILFLIEINENNNLTKILILPSFSNKLEQIIKDKRTINCTAYAFTLYNQYFTSLDYGAIIDEIPIIQKYKIENENKSKEKKERKINVYDEKAEENYYGNFEPKEEKKENNKNKRKNKKIEQNLTKTSKNSAYVILDDEPQNNQKNNENTIKNEKISNDDIQNEQPKERKKVIKTRKVKQTNTFIDKDGYMVTKDQYVDEEYETYEDEVEKKPAFHPQIQPNQPQKKNKKVQKGQTSLFNYFSK